MSKFYIKIDGAGFINKGSELMLYAVSNYILSNYKDAKLVLGPPRFTSFDQYSFSGIEFYKEEVFELLGYNLWHILPSKFMIRRGLLKSNMINAIFDIGGFSLGDQWVDVKKYSIENNKKLEAYYKKYKDNGTKIIFLPQAYGPFNNFLSIDRIKRISNYIDIFYARDAQSFEYLKEVIPDAKIELYPDFTSLQSDDKITEEMEIARDSIMIIPNTKMLSKTSKNISNNYIGYIAGLINLLAENGNKVVILNHEDKIDRKLISDILDKTNSEIHVIENLDSLQIKAAIGVSKIVISSRYHGLINALNQGVPAFATSWNHKYELLMEEYGLRSNILEISPILIKDHVKMIEIIKSDTNLTNRIKRQSEENREKTHKMWREINRILIL